MGTAAGEVMALPPAIDLHWPTLKRDCARRLAIGYSAWEAATALNLPIETLRVWMREKDFDVLVQDLHSDVWGRIEPQFMANIEIALLVEQEMFLGRIKADDKRYLEARRKIDRWTDRLLYVEPPDDSPRNRQAGVTVVNQIAR